MGNRVRKPFGPTTWVGLLIVLVVGGLFFVSIAQDTLTDEITAQIKAAVYDPDVAAIVVRDAVAGAPDQVAVIVRAAVEAAPHLATTLTAAAVVPVGDQVEPIQQAAAKAAPQQSRLIALAVDIAAKVASHPERDTEIVSAAIGETPGSSTTVVTAAATVCRFVTGCSPTSPMPLVKAAIAADRRAAESVVEVTVSLFPEAASEIIAAATQRPTPAPTARQIAEPVQVESVARVEPSDSSPAPDRALAPGAVTLPIAETPAAESPVIVADNTPVPGDSDVILPPAPAASEFPTPTSSGVGGGSGSDSGDGTGTGTGTVIVIPPLPPVFPASPFM